MKYCILLISTLLSLQAFSQSQQFNKSNFPNNNIRFKQAIKPDSLLEAKINALPLFQNEAAKEDWLVTTPKTKTEVYKKSQNEIVINNGLASRTFRVVPNLATISIKNLKSDEEYIRAVKPEAEVVINDKAYPIGGLEGQINQGYLKHEWLDQMTLPDDAFCLVDFSVQPIKSTIPWKKKRWLPTTQWEKTGKELIFHFTHPADSLQGIEVEVHYELFDNIPLFSKWIVVKNKGKDITLTNFTGEIIAHHEIENYVDMPTTWRWPNLYIENEFAFGGFTYGESIKSIYWEKDASYTSQSNYLLQMPCVIVSKPKIGPNIDLSAGGEFTSFKTYVLPLDGSDRERNSLAQRKMYRILAPWSAENPIFMHLISSDPKVVKSAIDQCVETGYEMVILSFGSGLNMEDTSQANYTKWKTLTDYAHEKGIELGSYSLFSSRKINEETDVIDLNTGKPGGAKFGNAPCLGSKWGVEYIEKLKAFYEQTGMDLLEHDGPYPGDFCASTQHVGHKGYADSQYMQWSQTIAFYQWLRAKGIYLNAPDFYFLSGSNKCSIGYREVNWSLPRAEQIILGRQNIYDATWLKTPSMGWTFVPLTQYHGGGDAATLEPLSDHLEEYGAHMDQNYGAGVQACYRGPRLYDSEETKKLVIEKITRYKQYRDILNADVIHLKRPTGRDWDGIMHVDPKLKTKGYALLYNPLEKAIKKNIRLPLYYTGLSSKALISINEGKAQEYDINRNYEVMLEVELKANSQTRIIIE